MRRFFWVLVLGVGLVALSGPAYATIDEFYIEELWEYELLGGGGSGYMDPDTGQQWFLYDQVPLNGTPNGPTAGSAPSVVWWNQWFYDDPPSWQRYKEIVMMFSFVPLDCTQPFYLNATINWSTMGYPETGPNGRPPMPDEEEWIQRAGTESIYGEWNRDTQEWDMSYNYSGDPWGYDSLILASDDGQTGSVTWWYTIDDFNPEWVSVDVWGWNVALRGTIEHECLPIPEPLTLSLLGMGVAGLTLTRMRKRV
jgi:hypothetical protein